MHDTDIIFVEESKMMRVISYDPLWKKLVDAKLNRTVLAEKAGLSKRDYHEDGKE